MLFLIGLNIGYAVAEVPKPVFVVEKTSVIPSGLQQMTVDRIVGCVGELETARNHVQSFENRLVEPKFRTKSYTKGIFSFVQPTCVLGDKPEGREEFTDFVMDFELYLYQVFNCTCGSCYVPSSTDDSEDVFDEDNVFQRVTPKIQSEYAVYKEKRTKEVNSSKEQYNLYVKEHDAWIQQFKTQIHDESVRISITPRYDMTQGVVTLYAFRWQHMSWCGDTTDISRQDIVHRTVELPPTAKGQTLHIWLHGVDSQLSWGAVLHKNDSSETILSQILQEAEQRKEAAASDLYGLPKALEGRAIELPPGTTSNIHDECCGC